MMARHSILPGAVAALCAVLVALAPGAVLVAQRGGGRGRSGGETADGAELYPPTRLQILETAFRLKKDQKKAIKAIMDEAHKSAAPIREGLISTRAAIAAAVEGNKGQAEIDAAVNGYAAQAAAMTALEMKALAQVLELLEPDQRANQPGIRSAFFLMRGMFLDHKRWDDVPDNRGY
jgi:Spy/CpxP family protein refolding chaperone